MVLSLLKRSKIAHFIILAHLSIQELLKTLYMATAQFIKLVGKSYNPTSHHCFVFSLVIDALLGTHRALIDTTYYTLLKSLLNEL